MTTEAAVSVDSLRKTYGTFTAVDDISFEIARGETFALLGPNGAGKSTTIEILEGYRERDSGNVSVLGTDPAKATTGFKSRLGIVLQSATEAGSATVREQVAHFASFYRHARDVDETIDAVGLTSKRNVQIRKLSGGQRRRVDVALGVIGRPELLFLDEPTTGFDPEARRQFWDFINLLKSEGTTILLTTHYLDEAAHLSDRAGVIAGGRFVAFGDIGTIGGDKARVPIVKWVSNGVAHEVRTDAPGALVTELTRNGEPQRLEIVRPSLEDIYLELVGAHS